MNSTKEQVCMFLDKCEELKRCKFIMATTKIKDLLKCIVNSPDLYELFETVTKDFNYIEQKTKCLVMASDGASERNYVALPQTIGQRLAFIFCLLVEFDRDTLNFNDFLNEFFRENGNYVSSYQAFCRDIITSLENMIRQVFKEQLAGERAEEQSQITVKANSVQSNLISSIELTIEAEKSYILQSKVQDDEKEGGIKMLNSLIYAVKAGNEELIDSLIFGYNYFVLFNKCVSDEIAPLIEMLSEYEKNL